MSKPSKNQTKNSTTNGSMCPSNSESFGQSSLADTSAGSGKAGANASTTHAPTSPGLIMNDFRRGGVSEGQNQPPRQQMAHPASCTNVTFENTNMSTASQSGSKPSQLDQKSPKSESTRTAIPISAKIQVTVDVEIAAGETRAGVDKQVQTNMPTQLSSVGQPLAFGQKPGFSVPTKNAACSPKLCPRSPA